MQFLQDSKLKRKRVKQKIKMFQVAPSKSKKDRDRFEDDLEDKEEDIIEKHRKGEDRDCPDQGERSSYSFSSSQTFIHSPLCY